MDKKFSEEIMAKIEKLIKSVSDDEQEERFIATQFRLKFNQILNETTIKECVETGKCLARKNKMNYLQRELAEKQNELKRLQEIDAADSEAKRLKMLEDDSDLFASQQIDVILETSLQEATDNNAGEAANEEKTE